LLKLAQICSNLLKFAQIWGIAERLASSLKCAGQEPRMQFVTFFFEKKMTGQENRTQSWLPPQIRGGGATRRTNCCVSPKLY